MEVVSSKDASQPVLVGVGCLLTAASVDATMGSSAGASEGASFLPSFLSSFSIRFDSRSLSPFSSLA